MANEPRKKPLHFSAEPDKDPLYKSRLIHSHASRLLLQLLTLFFVHRVDKNNSCTFFTAPVSQRECFKNKESSKIVKSMTWSVY